MGKKDIDSLKEDESYEDSSSNNYSYESNSVENVEDKSESQKQEAYSNAKSLSKRKEKVDEGYFPVNTTLIKLLIYDHKKEMIIEDEDPTNKISQIDNKRKESLKKSERVTTEYPNS